MTQLDLDTTTLATAAVDLHAAASTLTGVSGGGVLAAAAAPGVCGDAGLSAALQELTTAWRTTHAVLVDELGSLGAVLSRAADVFEHAERTTAHDLALLIGGPRPGDDA